MKKLGKYSLLAYFLLLSFAVLIISDRAEAVIRRPICGNAVCELGESKTNCPKDCRLNIPCGDGVCNKATENCMNCPPDCGQCPIHIMK